jgi:Uma2 family endonuclease
MSLMATGNLLTRADLDALPDDGLRHELIDGTLVMSPAPGPPHQRMARRLVVALDRALAASELEVLMAPLDVVLGPNVVEPDIIVAPRADFTDRDLPVPPLLAVEVRSPSTGWLDQGRKRTLYEEYGVTSYWLADPSVPSITILELREGRYVEVAMAIGDETISVEAPVHLSLNPAVLARG